MPEKAKPKEKMEIPAFPTDGMDPAQITAMQLFAAFLRKRSEETGTPFEHEVMHDMMEMERRQIMSAFVRGMQHLLKLFAENPKVLDNPYFVETHVQQAAHKYYNVTYNNR
jgi:hypothetical protein